MAAAAVDETARAFTAVRGSRQARRYALRITTTLATAPAAITATLTASNGSADRDRDSGSESGHSDIGLMGTAPSTPTTAPRSTESAW